MHWFRFCATVLAAGVAVAIPAAADPIEEFFKGKTVTFYIGAGAGGTYGLYGQLLVNHIGKHLPGHPTIVIKYHGASSGGVVAANFMHNAAAKDGSVIGMTQQTIPVAQLMRPGVGKFDVRQWNWIGNMAPVRNMLGVWHTAKAQTIDAAKKVEVVIGATGKSSPTYITPSLLNRYVGTKFKIIRGYEGTKGIDIAMERGEVLGRGASWSSIKIGHPDWVKEKKFKVLAFDATTRQPDLPDVPRIMDLVSDPTHRQVLELVGVSAEFGRAVFLPPGAPSDKVAAWRNAFDATMKDKAFLADAQKRKAEIEPMTAAEMEAMVKRVFAARPEVVEAARKVMGTL